jgi:hypothetical protein
LKKFIGKQKKKTSAASGKRSTSAVSARRRRAFKLSDGGNCQIRQYITVFFSSQSVLQKRKQNERGRNLLATHLV